MPCKGDQRGVGGKAGVAKTCGQSQDFAAARLDKGEILLRQDDKKALTALHCFTPRRVLNNLNGSTQRSRPTIKVKQERTLRLGGMVCCMPTILLLIMWLVYAHQILVFVSFY